MSELSRYIASKKQPPAPAKQRPAVTRQKRKRMNDDATYLALRDVYLEQNPACVLCGKPATQVHHIVDGIAGRARSLLNSDTWLGVCGDECHRKVEAFTDAMQAGIKSAAIHETILRLRRPRL